MTFSRVRAMTTDRPLDFEDDGHDHGAAAGGFLDEALELDADFFLNEAVVGFLFAAEAVDGFEHYLASFFSNVGAAEAAHDDFGFALDFAHALVDGEDGEDDAVFREDAAIADDEVLYNIDCRAGVDEDPSCGDFLFLAGVGLIEFEYVAVFNDHGVFDGAGLHGELGVAAEVAIVAVNRYEELGADEIDEKAQFLLTAVAADVDQAVGSV